VQSQKLIKIRLVYYTNQTTKTKRAKQNKKNDEQLSPGMVIKIRDIRLKR